MKEKKRGLFGRSKINLESYDLLEGKRNDDDDDGESSSSDISNVNDNSNTVSNVVETGRDDDKIENDSESESDSNSGASSTISDSSSSDNANTSGSSSGASSDSAADVESNNDIVVNVKNIVKKGKGKDAAAHCVPEGVLQLKVIYATGSGALQEVTEKTNDFLLILGGGVKVAKFKLIVDSHACPDLVYSYILYFS